MENCTHDARSMSRSVAALEKACFSDPWSEKSVASELENPLCLLAGGVGRRDGGGLRRLPDGDWTQTDMMNIGGGTRTSGGRASPGR